MKPRTKLEKQVDKLWRNLPPMTEAQHRWAFAKVFAHEAYWCKDEMWCSECGHVMPRTDSDCLVDLLDDEVTCTKCGARLKVVRSRRRKLKERDWVTVLTTCKGMQVARTWQIDREGCKGCETYKRAFEVTQLWLTEQGDRCVVACNRNMQGHCEAWVPGTMSIKRPGMYDPYCWQGYTYPHCRVLPSIRKRGWRDVPNLVDIDLMQLLIRVPRAETLIKAGQLDMVRYMAVRGWRARDEWHAVKIAMRRKYIVKDASMWVDYLRMLTELGRDTHNPKLVCPADLDKAHKSAQRKVEHKRAEEELRKQMERIKENEPSYQQSKGIYLSLVIKGSGITIRPLQSVAEFAEEGKAMRHCVFTREYYKDDDSLILSAKDADGNRIETIEYNLDTHKVVQSRGRCNSMTDRHDEIVRLMRGSVNKIKSIQRRSPAGQKTRRPA